VRRSRSHAGNSRLRSRASGGGGIECAAIKKASMSHLGVPKVGGECETTPGSLNPYRSCLLSEPRSEVSVLPSSTIASSVSALSYSASALQPSALKRLAIYQRSLLAAARALAGIALFGNCFCQRAGSFLCELNQRWAGRSSQRLNTLSIGRALQCAFGTRQAAVRQEEDQMRTKMRTQR